MFHVYFAIKFSRQTYRIILIYIMLHPWYGSIPLIKIKSLKHKFTCHASVDTKGSQFIKMRPLRLWSFKYIFSRQRFSTLLMESMAYVHHTSGIPGAHFITTGELRLKQKYLLRHSGRTTTYNVSALSHNLLWS